MSTAALAAVLSIGEKLRREHAEARYWISVRRSLLTHRSVVAIHDLFEEGMARREPANERNVKTVRAKRNTLHLVDEFDEGLAEDTTPFRDPTTSAHSTREKIPASDTLTARHTRLSYGYFCEGSHTRDFIGAGGHINCEADFQFTGQHRRARLG